MKTNISEMTLEELKSLAYDFARDLERVQVNLQLLNQEIVKREESDKKEVAVEEIKG